MCQQESSTVVVCGPKVKNFAWQVRAVFLPPPLPPKASPSLLQSRCHHAKWEVGYDGCALNFLDRICTL